MAYSCACSTPSQSRATNLCHPRLAPLAPGPHPLTSSRLLCLDQWRSQRFPALCPLLAPLNPPHLTGVFACVCFEVLPYILCACRPSSPRAHSESVLALARRVLLAAAFSLPRIRVRITTQMPFSSAASAGSLRYDSVPGLGMGGTGTTTRNYKGMLPAAGSGSTRKIGKPVPESELALVRLLNGRDAAAHFLFLPFFRLLSRAFTCGWSSAPSTCS